MRRLGARRQIAGLFQQLAAGAVHRIFILLQRAGGKLHERLANRISEVADQHDMIIRQQAKNHHRTRMRHHLALEASMRFFILQMMQLEAALNAIVNNLPLDQLIAHGFTATNYRVARTRCDRCIVRVNINCDGTGFARFQRGGDVINRVRASGER